MRTFLLSCIAASALATSLKDEVTEVANMLADPIVDDVTNALDSIGATESTGESVETLAGEVLDEVNDTIEADLGVDLDGDGTIGDVDASGDVNIDIGDDGFVDFVDEPVDDEVPDVNIDIGDDGVVDFVDEPVDDFMDEPVDETEEPGFWDGTPDGHSGRTTSWEDWIGKYHYLGATENWLDAMWRADSNRDGFVTLTEAIGAAESMGGNPAEWLLEEAATMPDDYRWDHDMDMVMQLLPLGFDHDGDQRLDYEETSDFFHAINSHQDDADELFFSAATLDYSDLKNLIGEMRYDPDGDLVSDQFQVENPLITMLRDMDANGDAIVSLREVVTFLADMLPNSTLDVDAFVAEHGEDFDWVQDPGVFTDMLTHDYDIETYDGLYDLLEGLQMPHATDQMFSTSWPETYGTTYDEFDHFWQMALTEPTESYWWEGVTEAWEGWVPRDDRFDATFKAYFTDVRWFSFYQPDFLTFIEGGQAGGSWDELTSDHYRMGGVNYTWWDEPMTVAGLMIPEVDGWSRDTQVDYETCYTFFDEIGFPWVLDTVFESYLVADDGANDNTLTGFIDEWMHHSDDWETSPPEGWYYMDDRLVPDWPWETNHDVARDHLHDEIRAAIARLEEVDTEVDTLPLSELTWCDDCDQQMEDLSELVFDTIEWAEDEAAEADLDDPIVSI